MGARGQGSLYADGRARPRALGVGEGGSRVPALGRLGDGGRAESARGRAGARQGARGPGRAARSARGAARGAGCPARAGRGRARCRDAARQRRSARPLRAHPPRQGAAGAVRAARRRLRALFHGGPHPTTRPHPAWSLHRRLRGLRRAAVRGGMIPARWAIAAPTDPDATQALAAELHIPLPLATLLVQRGYAAAVRAARAAGIDVIVTDHHLPGDELPPASAVLDPRRPDCPSTDKDLCGAGVAFKLAQALVQALALSENLPLHFLDYVALATVADVVPLTGENRILVRHGLKMLADSRWAGLRALVEAAGLAGKPLRAGHVGFILAPRLNAAGRIGDANDGLRLLLTDDPD